VTDPLKILERAAKARAEAEATLTKWIPKAFQMGLPIAQIARAADLPRPAIYGRLDRAGVRPADPARLTRSAQPTRTLDEVLAVVADQQAEVAEAVAVDGHHGFEAAWSEAGEPLMVCVHCAQWHDAEIHR
jgi:hypothetical protein